MANLNQPRYKYDKNGRKLNIANLGSHRNSKKALETGRHKGKIAWNKGKKGVADKTRVKMMLAKVGLPSLKKGKRYSSYIKPRDILPSERAVILKKYDYKCVQCGSTKDLQVDHIYPARKGGAYSLENYQVLCRKCNMKKWTRTNLGIVQLGKSWVGNLFGRYFYNAECARVIDGDTIVVNIDLGFHIFLKGIILRFSRINAYESRGKEKLKGLKAKVWLQNRIWHKNIIIETIKPRGKKLTDSFGRYIAEIFDKDGNNINDELCLEGHARYQKY